MSRFLESWVSAIASSMRCWSSNERGMVSYQRSLLDQMKGRANLKAFEGVLGVDANIAA